MNNPNDPLTKRKMPAWPNIPTSLSQPPTGGIGPAPMPDLGGNSGVSGYGPGGLPVPGLGTDNTMQPPNDGRAPNTYGDLDINGIIERALQSVLTRY